MFKIILIILIAIAVVGAYILVTDPQGFIDTFGNAIKGILDGIGGLFD